MEQQEEWIDCIRSVYLKSKIVGLIPLSAFEMLETEMDLTAEEWQMIARQTENRMQYEAAKEGTKALKELAHLRSSALYEITFTRECKKQAVANHFTKLNEMDNF